MTTLIGASWLKKSTCGPFEITDAGFELAINWHEYVLNLEKVLFFTHFTFKLKRNAKFNHVQSIPPNPLPKSKCTNTTLLTIMPPKS